MSNRSIVNVLLVLVVAGVVAGAAWFKSQRAQAPAKESAPSAGSAAAAQGAPPTPPPPTKPVAEGELCPEDVPATQPAAARATASQPAATQAVKLPRLVDLGADKCKACKELAPILDALREEYKGRLDVVFYDVWKDPAPAKKYGIRLIPTQILFDKDGKEVWRHEGFISKENLKKLFAEKVGVK